MKTNQKQGQQMKTMTTLLMKLTLTTSLFLSVATMAQAEQVYRAPAVSQDSTPSYYRPKNIEEAHDVIIRLTMKNGQPLCTAEYIGANTLLSAAHCVTAVEQKGGMYFGQEKLEVLAVDVARDVSILRTSQTSSKWLTIAGRDEKIMFKPSMIAIGYGAGVLMTSEVGMFYPENMVELSRYNVTSNIAWTVGGMSGGAVLDLETGKLTGIVQGGFTSHTGPLAGVGIFIPAPVILDVLDSIDMDLDAGRLVSRSEK